MAGPIQEIVGNHHRTSAAVAGVFAHSFQRLQAADQLPGFNTRYNTDGTTATETQPGAGGIEIAVYFFKE
jgi:hypothetical protein